MNIRGWTRAILLLMILLPGLSSAATYTLPAGFGSAPFGSCTWNSGTSTATCSGDLSIGSNDTINFVANMTINVAGNFTVSNNSNLIGTGYTVNIIAGGNITLGNSLVSAVNFTAGGNFETGNSANITGDITAGGNVVVDNGGTVTGNVIAGGSISLGTGTTVTGSCSPANSQCSNQCSSSTSGSITTVICTSNGSFTAPTGLSIVLVEAWGGGGGGGAATGNPSKGGGGAGGQYALKVVPVTAGTTYNIVVGEGGTGGTTGSGSVGGDSTFNSTTVVAKGGQGGGGATTNGGDGTAGTGATSGGIGDTVFAGGNGADGSASSQCNSSAGGGGGAGSGGSGGNASGNTGGTGTAVGGGNGGTASNSSGTGGSGSTYGGGGAGACAESGADQRGGTGAAGRVVITYTTAIATPLADYRFDECSQYTGAAGEVVNSVSTSYVGRPMGGLQNATPGQIQRYADFSTATKYVDVTSGPSLATDWTLSTWFKTPFAGSGSHSSQYYVLASMSGGGDFIYLDRASSGGTYRWGVYTTNTSDSAGSGGTNDGVFRFGALSDGWHHLTLVGSGNVTRLYIDGVYKDYVNRKNKGTFRYLGASYDSAGTSSGQSFGTPLDEFMVFNRALQPVEIATVWYNQYGGKNYEGTMRSNPCVAIDHIRIEHDGEGLTCMPETATVRACADSSCSSEYTAGNVTTTLSPTGWVGGDTITFGGGHTTVSLAKTTTGPVTLGAASTIPTPTNATRCFIGASETCAMNFVDAGFIFSAAADGAEANVLTQIAGTAFGPYWLRAVKTATTTKACEAAITSPQTVNFNYVCADPASCSSGNLMAIGASSVGSTATAVNLTFDANGNASLGNIAYLDVGKITLAASATVGTSTLSGNLTGPGGSPFVVKPYTFVVTATNPTIDTSNPFVAAGQSFTATIEARNSLGDPTPNYGRETTPEGIKLTPAVTTPASGANGMMSGSVTSFTSGAGTGTFSWNEVGIVSLTPSVADGDYLVTGDVTGTAIPAGRFYPHHFKITPGGLTPGCDSSSNDFTYMGQPFTFYATVEAHSMANATTGGTEGITTNYGKTGYAPVQSSGLTVVAENAASGTDLGGRISTAPSPLTLNWSMSANGTAALGASGTPISATFSRSTMDGPYESLNIGLKLTQTDGSKTIATIGNMLTNSAGVVAASTTRQRYGRLKLNNTHGSELIALSMPATAQYCSAGCAGTATWITNPDDTCTVLGSGTFALVYTGSLNSTNYPTSKIGSTTLNSGAGTLALTNPTGNATGSATLTSSQAWLPGVGVATFGIYNQAGSANKIILRREAR